MLVKCRHQTLFENYLKHKYSRIYKAYSKKTKKKSFLIFNFIDLNINLWVEIVWRIH